MEHARFSIKLQQDNPKHFRTLPATLFRKVAERHHQCYGLQLGKFRYFRVTNGAHIMDIDLNSNATIESLGILEGEIVRASLI